MRNGSGLSTSTLAGAAILAIFVLAGAFLMASSSPTTGTATQVQPQQIGFHSRHMGRWGVSENTPQSMEITIMQDGPNPVLVYSTWTPGLQVGQTILVRNQTSAPQSYVLVNNSNPALEDHCSAHRAVVVAPGETAQVVLPLSGSYTLSLVSNPDAQATFQVSGN